MEKKLTYEEAITALEDVVKKLEQGDITLEETIDLFSRGMNLVKVCNQYLEEAEEKIKILIEDDKLEDFKWSKED